MQLVRIVFFFLKFFKNLFFYMPKNDRVYAALDLHPREPAVDFKTLMKVGAREDCKRPFRPQQQFPEWGYFPSGPREWCTYGGGDYREHSPVNINDPGWKPARGRWLLKMLHMLSHVTTADSPRNVIDCVLTSHSRMNAVCVMYVIWPVLPYPKFHQ